MAIIKEETKDYYRRKNQQDIEGLKRSIAWCKIHGHDTRLAEIRLIECIEAEEREKKRERKKI